MKVGRLSQRGNSYAVTIPAEIRRELQWWPGDEIVLEAHNSELILRNATQHDVTLVKREKRYGDTHERRA